MNTDIQEYERFAKQILSNLEGLEPDEKVLILRSRITKAADAFGKHPTGDAWETLYALMCARQTLLNDQKH
jgi:hypothetical protein